MKIVCFGDSNMYGFDPRSFFGEPLDFPWPKIMERNFGFQVVNLGQNGRELPHSNYQLMYTSDRIRKEEPFDYLVILLGSNDILNTPVDGLRTVASRLSGFLNSLTLVIKPEKIILMTPYLIEGLEPYITKTCQGIRPLYQKAAEVYGLNLFDLNDLDLATACDRVHFTEEAHGKIAASMGKYLKQMPRDGQMYAGDGLL